MAPKKTPYADERKALWVLSHEIGLPRSGSLNRW